jgi:hypothetical protein
MPSANNTRKIGAVDFWQNQIFLATSISVPMQSETMETRAIRHTIGTWRKPEGKRRGYGYSVRDSNNTGSRRTSRDLDGNQKRAAAHGTANVELAPISKNRTEGIAEVAETGALEN